MLVSTGHRIRCWLQFSMFAFFLLALCMLGAGGFFVSPSGRDRAREIIDKDNSKTGSFVDHNLLATGLAFIAVAALHLAAVLFMYCQTSALVEDLVAAEDDAEEAAEDANDPLLQTEEGRSMSKRERQSTNASRKYQEKNSAIYEKYNIGRA